MNRLCNAFKVSLLATALFLSCLFAFPASAFADDISFDVRVIEARIKSESSVDSALSGLGGELEGTFEPYNVFVLIDRKTLKTNVGSGTGFTLPDDGGTHFVIQVDSKKPDGSLLVSIIVNGTSKAKLQTTSQATFYQAGFPYKNGILILAITPE